MQTPQREHQTNFSVAWLIAEAARQGGHTSSSLLAKHFQTHRSNPRDKKQISEQAYAILRNFRLFEWISEQGGQSVRQLAAQSFSGQHIIAPHQDRYDRLSLQQKIALRASIPDWLASRIEAQFDAESLNLAHAFTEKPVHHLRCNVLQTTREALKLTLARHGIDTSYGQYAPNALYVSDGTYDLFRTQEFQSGLFELQDEGSQCIAEAVAPPPGAVVVDLCAGEGGKTLAIAAAMKGKGRIFAYDISAEKLQNLKARARRAKAHNIETHVLAADGSLPDTLKKWIGKVDRVLVDAPCTGTGTLRRHVDIRYRITEPELQRLITQQRQILNTAAPLVKENGRLIYATCSMLREENEEQAQWLLEQTGWSVFSLKELWGTSRAKPLMAPDGQFLRTSPHKHACDGFFAAILRRTVRK